MLQPNTYSFCESPAAVGANGVGPNSSSLSSSSESWTCASSDTVPMVPVEE